MAKDEGKIAETIRTKSRDQWVELMEGTDVCFAPVLSPSEAYAHPHNVERETFIEVAGVKQPAPAPRFSRTQEPLMDHHLTQVSTPKKFYLAGDFLKMKFRIYEK